MKMIKTYKGKKILVLGLAKSGTEAAKLLNQLGAFVTVNDQRPYHENLQAQEIETLGIKVVCGEHPESLVDESIDYVVKNPGIRYDHPLIVKALKLAIPVITEIELAYQISDADMIGITGSNGKTTTTTYIGDMLEGGKKTPLLAGNIGQVACSVAQHATENHQMVVELSSFQLMGTEHFSPHIGILLNIVEAHIDYHGSKENYMNAKKRMFVNQTNEDYLIFNADDCLVSSMVCEGHAQQIPFSTKKEVKHGACIIDDWLSVFNEKLIPVAELSLPGEHNISNALAAAVAAILSGADKDQIRHVLRTFKGVEHRLQYVGKTQDRLFYNNSKATNVSATLTALQAFKQPVVLIAGGLDRGLSFDGLIPLLTERVSVVVTYGETKHKLFDTAKRAFVPKIKAVDTLKEATEIAYDYSKRGDIILLSPSCASWDQFKTFEERGENYTSVVERIIDKNLPE